LGCFCRGGYRGGRDQSESNQSNLPPRFVANVANGAGRAPQQDGYGGVSGWKVEPQQDGNYQGHTGDNRWDVGRGNQQHGNRNWTGYPTGVVGSGAGSQQQWNQDKHYSDGEHWDEVKECADPTDWTKPLPRNEKLEQ